MMIFLPGPLLALALAPSAPAQVVPRPKVQTVAAWPGKASPFDVQELRIRCDQPELRPAAEVLLSSLERLGAPRARWLDPGAEGAAALEFRAESAGPGNTYRIDAEGTALIVRAESARGGAHAVATLLQLVDLEGGRASWPALHIQDGPDLPYRSFMVDMGRNPHGPGTLRQVVDLLAYYKLNYLHLHLADDQLCSWPSRAFPRLLSERAGWTWEDFVALEEYSQARGVTLLPELDVPGHSTILRREYPEVFGADPSELASSPAAQAGVQTLLGEMMEVFQASPYVHVGGDEAYGVPEELQRDFINRLNDYVRAQGRRCVVWEGPRLGEGENKVDEDVLQMNWRTINVPAQEMLEAGYQVVNAAWDPMYIVDHYPRTMFTAVDLERCYGWDLRSFAHVNHGMPTFARPHRTASAEGIVGFCMPWWEGREQNLLPLCSARLAAVASAAWNREGEDDFASFLQRERAAAQRLALLRGSALPALPLAAEETQGGNRAFLGRVRVSRGAHQPHFGPQRLTNGITERFDHFLGFPTQPDPLEIVIELPAPALVGRIVVHETAVGQSHELYELLVSADGQSFEKVGATQKESRGEQSFVQHDFPRRQVGFIKLLTQGCHGLTFPSFSRLTEVMAFEGEPAPREARPASRLPEDRS